MVTKRMSLFLLGGSCLLLALASPVVAQKGKGGGGAAARAIVTINDAFPGSGAGVVSDTKGIYIDSQLPDGDPCVNAFVKNDGFFNIQMDFSPDVGSGCNSILGMQSTNRFYELRFPAGHAACSQFGLTASGGVCALVLSPSSDEPIIGIPKLFSGSPSQVRFRFKRNGSFWVVALTGVPVNPTQNPQTVTHIGPAKLFNDDKGNSGGYQVGTEFTFALEITVERVP